MTALAFAHGWGFDARIWQSMLSRLPLKKTICFDYGFFGESHVPPWDENCDYIIVTHSMGLLWAAHYWPPKIRAIVAINGFPKFCRSADFSVGVEPIILQKMQQKFARMPEAVLADFHKRIQTPPMAIDQISPAMLGEALDWLGKWDARAKLTEIDAPVRILAANDDPLISVSHSRSFIDINPTIDLRYCESGGHILPITQPQWCVDNLIDLVS